MSLNSTSTVVFSSVEKGFLVPSIFCSVLALGILLHKYAKKPLFQNETIEKRLQYFYSLISGAMFGWVLFHGLPNLMMDNPQGIFTVYLAFFALAFYAMMWLQKYAQIWHTNPFLNTNAVNNVEIRHSLDYANMELKSHQYDNDLTDETEEYEEANHEIQQEMDELENRRKLLYVLLGCMLFIVIVEGFFLVYLSENSVTGLMIAMFVINKLLQSSIVYITMLHALMHVMKRKRYKWYWIITLVWITACICSTIPALTDVTPMVAESIVHHWATTILYSLACGTMFSLFYYFMMLDMSECEKIVTIKRLLIFGAIMVMSWVTGFFI